MDCIIVSIQIDSFEFCRVALGLLLTDRACLQGWNSLLVRPEPLLNKDIKVQVNKQKPNNVRPAQMKHNSDKMPIVPTSSQPCSKPMFKQHLRWAPSNIVILW